MHLITCYGINQYLLHSKRYRLNGGDLCSKKEPKESVGYARCILAEEILQKISVDLPLDGFCDEQLGDYIKG